MDSNRMLSGALSGLLIFGNRLVWLGLSPYKTMRSIHDQPYFFFPGIVAVLIAVYYIVAGTIRPYTYGSIVPILLAYMHVLGTSCFFVLMSRGSLTRMREELMTYIATFSMTYIPTLIWFSVNLLLYVLIPPPRTPTIWGAGFSLIYLAFTLSLVVWKIILLYLAIRFATGFRFYRIVYVCLVYGAAVVPYGMLLIQTRMVRIPFF